MRYSCLCCRANSFSQTLLLNGDSGLLDLTGVQLIVVGKGNTYADWVVDAGSVDWNNGYWQSAHGRQSVDVSGREPGIIYQDLATTPNQPYLLRFAVAGNARGEPAEKRLRVWWGTDEVDVASFNVTDHTLQDMGWIYYQYEVTATSDSTRLKFESLALMVLHMTMCPWYRSRLERPVNDRL